VPKEVPPRGEGRWIRFAQQVPSPDLWIARTMLSGEKSLQRFEGLVNDISNDQRALGRALTFDISSDGPLVRGLRLKGEDNRLGEKVIDTLTFRADTVPVKNFDLERMQINNSKMGLDGRMTIVGGSKIIGASSVTFREAEIALDGLGGKGAQIMNDILSGIKSFGARVEVEGSLDTPAIKVTSDLDRRLSQGFKKVMAKEISAYEKELKGLLDEQLKGQLASLNKMGGGMSDTGKLIDQQSLSLDALGQNASGLLESGGSAKPGGDDIKKLFRF